MTAPLPTLSQLLNWPYEHLNEAPAYWQALASKCYDAVGQVWRDTLNMDWEGEVITALRAATGADKTIAANVYDQVTQQACKEARSGASQILDARNRLKYKVQDAEEAGFSVSEDMSVYDTHTTANPVELADRQAQAQAFAEDIRLRAAKLVTADTDVAQKVTATMAGIGPQAFGEPINADDTIIGDNKHNGVQLVDFTQDNAAGTNPPPFAPWDTPDGTPPPGTGLSPKLQQMLLGSNPASLTGQGLVENMQRFVQSLPENDPRTAWLRGQVADLQAHVTDIEYARTHCTTRDWIERTSQFASGVIVTGYGLLAAETGVGLAVAGAGGVGTIIAGTNLLRCLTGSK